MNIIQRMLCTISAVIFIISACCRKNPAGFTMPDDPRTYTWTADTLAGGLYKVWGSTPQDVYATGDDGCDPDRFMYHFDGKTWKPCTGIRSINTYPGIYFLTNILGFGKDNIWVTGGFDTVIQPGRKTCELVTQYNGSEWYVVYISKYYTVNHLGITSIWGSSPENMWFGGACGTMLHWDGTEMSRDSLPSPLYRHMAPDRWWAEIHAMAGQEGHGLFASFFADDGYTCFLLERTEDTWVIRDSLHSYIDLWMSPSGTLYAANFDGVHKWTGTSLEPCITDICCWSVFGTDDNNIFATGSVYNYNDDVWYNGDVVWYNGVRWQHIDGCQYDNIHYLDGWTDGNEIFLVASMRNSCQNLMVRGKQ